MAFLGYDVTVYSSGGEESGIGRGGNSDVDSRHVSIIRSCLVSPSHKCGGGRKRLTHAQTDVQSLLLQDLTMYLMALVIMIFT